jgi:hypothetical protein
MTDPAALVTNSKTVAAVGFLFIGRGLGSLTQRCRPTAPTIPATQTHLAEVDVSTAILS